MKRVLIIVVLLACGGFIFNLIQNASPPEPIIKAGDVSIPTEDSSSCWSGSCADYASPYEMRNTIKKVVVKPGTKIEIGYDKEPIRDTIGASLWLSNQAEDVELNGRILTAPIEPGIYVYSIHAKWKKGSVSHIFRIEVQ